jgi:5-methyltetrahydropteroyltriglutamate--homocysteine methyltransferase
MFKATKDIVLPTTVTGSLPRPCWYDVNLRGRTFSVAMAEIEFREQYCDAVAVAIADQSRAGLDILVDGDSRFDMDVAGRSWFAYVGERLKGLAPGELRQQLVASNRDKQPGDILFEVVETRLSPSVIGKIERGPLEYDRLWKVAQRYTEKPVKLGGISAQLFEGLLTNNFYRDRRELVMDISTVLNEEYHQLADAGCPIIQVEEPAIHESVGIVDDKVMTPDFYVEAFNREVAGLRAKTEVWCHTCWGSPAAQRVEHDWHSYKASLPYFNQFDVDVLTFEAADDEGRDLEIIGKGIAKDKKIAIGVVSHRKLEIERPDKVVGLIRHALKYIEPERLILSTDCGFGRQGMSRMHAFYKMVAITRGANIIRKELGLSEVPISAADSRMTLLASR